MLLAPSDTLLEFLLHVLVVLVLDAHHPRTLRAMSRPTHRPQVSSGYYAAAPSSREAYPTFLSFPESALLHLHAAGRGLLDACRWDVVVRRAARCVRGALSSFSV